VRENVSTIDILPTLADLGASKLWPDLLLDGSSLLPLLQGKCGNDTVFGEYCGEGTIAPLMMIRRGPWKYIKCPADKPQLFNLDDDPLELENLAQSKEVAEIFQAFEKEAVAKWDFEAITRDVLRSQRQRRLVWSALKQGRFTSWDYDPEDDARSK
jgi:arylsulfatase A-like enzyme